MQTAAAAVCVECGAKFLALKIEANVPNNKACCIEHTCHGSAADTCVTACACLAVTMLEAFEVLSWLLLLSSPSSCPTFMT